jgi:hypothetical protein
MFNLCSAAMTLAGVDPGMGDVSIRRALGTYLKADHKNGGVAFNGVDYLTIEYLIPSIEAHYLSNWALAVKDPNVRPNPERAARYIAAHLLDLGLHPNFLHKWWTYRIVHEGGTRNLSDLILDAHVLAIQKPITYRILVAFPTGTTELNTDPRWLSADQVSVWLKNNHSLPIENMQGGLLLEVESRDKLAAVALVAETIDRLVSRIMLGTKNKFSQPDKVWIEGSDDPNLLVHRGRRVEVHSLDRQDKIFPSTTSTALDAALDLLAPLERGSPSAAVAGAWAAIEALLTAPGDSDRVVAADRMGELIACSFPRAELTRLSFKIEKLGGSLEAQLKACINRCDRCNIVASEIKKGTAFSFKDYSDAAAFDRMKTLLLNPTPVLQDIQKHASQAFRRLYRHRNLVLHGGQTEAVGLRAALRTTAPLVGAAVDRIAHANFVEGISAVKLAARAHHSLSVVGAPNGPTATTLLD